MGPHTSLRCGFGHKVWPQGDPGNSDSNPRPLDLASLSHNRIVANKNGKDGRLPYKEQGFR